MDFSLSPNDPERGERGDQCVRSVLGIAELSAHSPYRAAGRDFVFSEVWSRPGLDRRSRLWITLACVCAAGAQLPMETYLRAALRSGEINLRELREFVLQFAVFQGFPKGAEVEMLLDRIESDGTEI